MSTATDIEEQEGRLVQALQNKDREGLESLLAPEFRLVGIRSTGSSDMPREQWLAAAPEMSFHRFEVEVKSVEAYGDTAIATVDGYWRMDWRDLKIDERFFLTDVWLRRGGDWQLVRRHSSPYEQARAPGGLAGNRQVD